MKLSLASAYAVTAALLLAHSCAPNHSTDAAFLSKWGDNVKAFFVRSIPGSKKPTKGGAAAASTASVQTQAEDFVAKHRLDRRPMAEADSNLLKHQLATRHSMKHNIENPFVYNDRSTIEVIFTNKNTQLNYSKSRQRGMKKPQPFIIEQSQILLPTNLIRYNSRTIFESGSYYDYRVVSEKHPDVVHWWVNFVCDDGCAQESKQDTIMKLEVPAVATLAKHLLKYTNPQTAGRTDLLKLADGITIQPMAVANLYRYSRFDPTKSTTTILKISQPGIHVLALFAPQCVKDKAGQLPIRSMLEMWHSAFIQARRGSMSASDQYNNQAFPIVHSHIGYDKLFICRVLSALTQMAAARVAGVEIVAWESSDVKEWNLARGLFVQHVLGQLDTALTTKTPLITKTLVASIQAAISSQELQDGTPKTQTQ